MPGLVEPVALYRAQAAHSVQSRLDWFAQTQRLSPFCGREQELAQLEASRVAAQGGHGHVVLLSGEAGIGKSRLLWEWKQSLSSSVTWLESQCSPHHQNTSLYPITGLLAQICRFAADDDVHIKREKVDSVLARFDLAASPTAWLFSLLLELPTDLPAPQTITAEQRERIWEAVVALVQRQAAAHPTVLVIEDLHWSDPTTAEWLGRSCDALAAAPCLMVLTYRPPFAFTSCPGAHQSPLTLSPLSPIRPNTWCHAWHRAAP